MYIVGSHALEHYVDISRDPNDIDLIGTYGEINEFLNSLELTARYPLNDSKIYAKAKGGLIIESEIAWEDTTAEWFMRIAKEDAIERGYYKFPSLNLLYALKMSHRYLKNSPSFRKTMDDIILMRTLGAVIEDKHRDWYEARMKETYSYQHPKLNRKKSEFFNPDAGVQYIYDHDSIHGAMKHGDKPAYSYFKPDEAEVLTSRKMFEALPYEVRLNAVLEESYVLALERSQIPHPKSDPEWSFLTALEKVCTSITSGWFREFAWENYHQAVNRYDPNYVEWFRYGLARGVVKPFTSGM